MFCTFFFFIFIFYIGSLPIFFYNASYSVWMLSFLAGLPVLLLSFVGVSRAIPTMLCNDILLMWIFHSSFLSCTLIFILSIFHVLISSLLVLPCNVLPFILFKIIISFVSKCLLVSQFLCLISSVQYDSYFLFFVPIFSY